MKPWSWPNNTRYPGFTLVEAIIALSITTLLIFVIMEFINVSLRMQTYFANESTSQIDTRRSINLMTQQLREISDGDDGAYALAIAEPYQIIFYSDIDKDVVAEKIQYAITDTSLQRTTINPTADPIKYLTANGVTTTLATGLTNISTNTPLFLYYDANNTELVSPIDLKNVTLIKIQLQLPNHTTETYVQLRNLKTNL